MSILLYGGLSLLATRLLAQTRNKKDDTQPS
jgi:hypothetical protein